MQAHQSDQEGMPTGQPASADPFAASYTSAPTHHAWPATPNSSPAEMVYDTAMAVMHGQSQGLPRKLTEVLPIAFLLLLFVLHS